MIEIAAMVLLVFYISAPAWRSPRAAKWAEVLWPDLRIQRGEVSFARGPLQRNPPTLRRKIPRQLCGDRWPSAT